MNPRKPRVPSYRHHKPSGQAVVTLNGRDIYLGPWDTPESKAAYDRFTAEWLARGRQQSPPPAREQAAQATLLKEVILAYYRHCEATVRPVELDKVRDALKPVRLLYGETEAVSFDAISYPVIRSKMVEAGLSISTIRNRLSVVKKMLGWGVVRRLIPHEVPALIKELERSEPLRIGQVGVKAPKEVKPVPEEVVRAIFPFVTPVVKAMLEIQLYTGMRPGEVCRLSTGQLDRSGEIWVYRPAKHKTAHLGKRREISLGPQAQAILQPWLKADPDKVLFSPRESYEHGHKLTGRRPRRFQETYNKGSYANAVVRGCERAGVPIFRPNRLRHTFATLVRKQFGLEAAQVMLGHSRADVTQVYAESNRELAAEVARKIG
jgi:integrase